MSNQNSPTVGAAVLEPKKQAFGACSGREPFERIGDGRRLDVTAVSRRLSWPGWV